MQVQDVKKSRSKAALQARLEERERERARKDMAEVSWLPCKAVL